eukprot:symbB.v1.2.009543.t1/scaffold604.1/size182248/1
MALVNVDVFSIATAKFRMTEFDSIADLKHLIEELIGIDHKDIVLKHSVANHTLKTSTDELLIGYIGLKSLTREELICKLFMTSPTIAHLKIAHELRALQDSVSTNEHKFFRDGVAVATKCFVSLASHKLFQDETCYAMATVLPSAPASSSTPDQTFHELKLKIEKLETQNDECLSTINNNKATIKELKLKLKDAPISINLRFMSGNTYQLNTAIGKTVKRFRVEDLSAFTTPDVRLLYGDQLMENRKRLFSYGITDNSIIDVVLVNNSIQETDTEQTTTSPLAVAKEVASVVHPMVVSDVSEGSSDEEWDENFIYSLDFPDFPEDVEIDNHPVENPTALTLTTKTGSHCINLRLPPSSLVSDVVNEISDITELQKGSYVLIGAVSGERWSSDRSISSLGCDNFKAFIQLTLSGGGKRKEPTGGINTESKGTKLDKIEQAKDNLRTAIMKAQMATGADTSGYHQALTDMFGQLQAHLENPASVMLNSLGINDLKSIQGLLFTTRLEYKYQSMVKVFFGAMHQAMTESGKRNLALMDAQKALLTWSLLQEFGDDDNGSISWNKMNKTVMDIMQSKMSAPNPAPTA